jgi:ribonuclease BN (tRNA processing enzyme)
MRVKVLGCSGGIGGILRTTGFLVDNDILLDAGTGVGDLSIEQLIEIDHIFITHSHLDHIASIPLLVDTVFGMKKNPVYV